VAVQTKACGNASATDGSFLHQNHRSLCLKTI
jgi:hypothetical protein